MKGKDNKVLYETKTNQNETNLNKDIKKKRLSKNQLKALILAVVATITIGLSKKLSEIETKVLLDEITVEEVLEDNDFTLTASAPDFLSLLQANDYDVDTDLIGKIDMNNIYTMYEYIWAMNSSKEEDINTITKNINEKIPDFISTLKELVSTRIPGEIVSIKGEEITVKVTETVNVPISNTKDVKNKEHITYEFYDEEGNVVEKENSNSSKQVLPVTRTTTYKIKVTDKDMLLLMKTIENEDNKEFFDKFNLYKIISSAIRVSCNNYVTVYENQNIKNTNYQEETQEVVSNATLKKNQNNPCHNAINDAFKKLKKLIISYYNLDTKPENIEFMELDNILYVIDSKTTNITEISDEVILGFYNDIVECKNKTEELKYITEEEAISKADYLGYTEEGQVGITEIAQRIRTKKIN